MGVEWVGRKRKGDWDLEGRGLRGRGRGGMFVFFVERRAGDVAEAEVDSLKLAGIAYIVYCLQKGKLLVSVILRMVMAMIELAELER